MIEWAAESIRLLEAGAQEVDRGNGWRIMDVSSDVIVVGVDGTEQSLRAAGWAARQAEIFGKPLVLAHGMRWPVYADTAAYPTMVAIPPDIAEEPMRRQAQDMLDGIAERCRDVTGVEVRTAVVPGGPADAVTLTGERVAFAVVGHSGDGGLARFLLGSNAERLTRSCQWPVVVVRGEFADDDPSAGGPVVVGVDGSAVSGEAVRFAFRFAARHAADVVVVHASSEITSAGEPLDTLEAKALREGWGPAGAALADCARLYPGVRHRLEDVSDTPAAALLAASARACLLVVGSHGKGSVRRALMGSVSHEVVNSSPCPVAVLSAEVSANRS